MSQQGSTSSNQESPKLLQNEVKFSIENILGLNRNKNDERDPSPTNTIDSDDDTDKETCDESSFSWLQCTRYKPPKLPRIKKKDNGKKRKLGRNPRVPFSQHQVAVLEDKFRRTHYLSSMDVAELSSNLNLSETRVKIWFQNRRARERRDRDAAQHSQIFHSNKTVSPLSIPNISWPVTSPTTSSAFVHFRTALELSRSGYLPSAFSLYPSRATPGKGSSWSETNNLWGEFDNKDINQNK